MKIIGHRGTGISGNHIKRREPGRLPENTLAAFRAAFDAGADGIETDIFLTKDGQAVCIHDDELNLHVAGADPRKKDKGFVHEKTWAELRGLDTGQGHGIPHLEEVFALAAQYPGVTLHLELKGAGTGTAVPQLVKAKAPASVAQQVVYTGFDRARLGAARKENPAALISPGAYAKVLFPLAVKGGKSPGWHAPVRALTRLANRALGHQGSGRLTLARRDLDAMRTSLNPEGVHVYLNDVTAGLISYARRHDMQLYVWTMRERNPAQDRAAANFVKAHRNDPDIHLITDYPAQMVRLRNG